MTLNQSTATDSVKTVVHPSRCKTEGLIPAV